jgi:hypothetical protein
LSLKVLSSTFKSLGSTLKVSGSAKRFILPSLKTEKPGRRSSPVRLKKYMPKSDFKRAQCAD